MRRIFNKFIGGKRKNNERIGVKLTKFILCNDPDDEPTWSEDTGLIQI